MQDEEISRLIDYLVYAPVGIITSVAEALPRAVETGRSVVESRTMVAKFIGKMAVDRASDKVMNQVDELRRQFTASVSEILPDPWGDLAKFVFGQNVGTPESDKDKSSTTGTTVDVSASDPDVEPHTINGVAGTSSTGVSSPETTLTVNEIETIIPRYSTLSATQIVAKLSSLNVEQLGFILSFEEKNRGRRTIVAKAQRLIADDLHKDGSRA